MRDPELEMELDELCQLNTNRDPTETELFDIYKWIDNLSFSRPKKNIARDFSDGVLMAQLIAQYLPKLVDPSNYTASLSTKNKANNWNHLVTKVFCKLGYKIDKTRLNEIMESKHGAIEKTLFELRPLLARKNRSILNYRIGGKPEVPDVAPVALTIPKSTLAFESKRRTKPMQYQPQPLQPRSQKPVPSKIMEQPKMQKMVTVQPMAKPKLLQSDDSITTQILTPRRVPTISPNPTQSRSQNCLQKRVIEEALNERVLDIQLDKDKEMWGYPPPPVASVKTPHTKKYAMFEEQLLLSGTYPKRFNGQEDSRGQIEGIPGVSLGLYGLV